MCVCVCVKKRREWGGGGVTFQELDAAEANGVASVRGSRRDNGLDCGGGGS